MGNAQNKQDLASPKKSLSQIIDYIAANYILTQNFEDMKKLSDMKYCNNLVILTSKVIANNLNNLEIQYLAQRLKGTEEINEMTKDKIIFLNKNNLQNLDVRNQTQKRRLCIGIAKHYVKIAHLFAAIATTINPTYTYTDASGQRLDSTLEEKQSIPEDASVKIKRINICNKRIDALINNQKFDVADNESITVKPNFCQMNYDSANNSTKVLYSEPGIPELEKLYYDKYDYDKGNFTGMTDKMRKDIYEKDVETFYKIFTGKDKIPVGSDGQKTIKTFSQIPLKDFHKSEGCKPDGVYNKSSGYQGSLKDKLFKQYAEHTKDMMNKTTANQNKLLSIIDKLFVFSVNPQTNKKEIVINPALNEKSLQEIVETTRFLIIDLYVTCENEFLKGLEIFEAIVEKQIIDTSKEQIKELENVIDNTLASSDISETIKSSEENVVEAPAEVEAPTKVEAPAEGVITEVKTSSETPITIQAPALVEGEETIITETEMPSVSFETDVASEIESKEKPITTTTSFPSQPPIFSSHEFKPHKSAGGSRKKRLSKYLKKYNKKTVKRNNK